MSQIIAANLRLLRAEKGWSQLDVAQKLGLKTHGSVGHWERGQTPERETVQRLAVLYGCDIERIDPLGEAFTTAKRKPRGPGMGKPLQKSHNNTDTTAVAPSIAPPEAGVLMDAGGLFNIPDAELFQKVLGVYLTLDTPAERAEFVKYARSFVPGSTKAKNSRR